MFNLTSNLRATATNNPMSQIFNSEEFCENKVISIIATMTTFLSFISELLPYIGDKHKCNDIIHSLTGRVCKKTTQDKIDDCP